VVRETLREINLRRRAQQFVEQYCLSNVDADGTQLNDFNVTVQSARYAPPPPNVGFTELTSLKHNHTTIGKSITLFDGPVVVLGNLLAVEQALP
jgi:hypothetical protein